MDLKNLNFNFEKDLGACEGFLLFNKLHIVYLAHKESWDYAEKPIIKKLINYPNSHTNIACKNIFNYKNNGNNTFIIP